MLTQAVNVCKGQKIYEIFLTFIHCAAHLWWMEEHENSFRDFAAFIISPYSRMLGPCLVLQESEFWTTAGFLCRAVGAGGATGLPKILIHQLTPYLNQGENYAHYITTCRPPDFQTFLRPCSALGFHPFLHIMYYFYTKGPLYNLSHIHKGHGQILWQDKTEQVPKYVHIRHRFLCPFKLKGFFLCVTVGLRK